MFYTLPYSSKFDSIFDEFLNASYKTTETYPPYSVSTVTQDGETLGVIEIAATGLSEDNVKVYFDDENFLVIEGTYPKEETERTFSHKGLSTKDFKRRFQINKNFVVKTVILKNGLLRIFLKEEKPDITYIPINTSIDSTDKIVEFTQSETTEKSQKTPKSKKAA